MQKERKESRELLNRLQLDGSGTREFRTTATNYRLLYFVASTRTVTSGRDSAL